MQNLELVLTGVWFLIVGFVFGYGVRHMRSIREGRGQGRDRRSLPGLPKGERRIRVTTRLVCDACHLVLMGDGWPGEVAHCPSCGGQMVREDTPRGNTVRCEYLPVWRSRK